MAAAVHGDRAGTGSTQLLKPVGMAGTEGERGKGMNKEMLQTIESVSNEKGVAKEIIFEALELALATAAPATPSARPGKSKPRPAITRRSRRADWKKFSAARRQRGNKQQRNRHSAGLRRV